MHALRLPSRTIHVTSDVVLVSRGRIGRPGLALCELIVCDDDCLYLQCT